MTSGKEIEFLRTYKNFIYTFNMLDRNIGYCLRYCSKRALQKNPEKWISASFDSKIRKVIILAKSFDLDTVFSEWHSNVEKCRYLRNIVAHGHWEWLDYLEKPIHYHAPEIKNGKGSFTVDEFQEKLIFLQDVGESFREIRKSLELACEKLVQPDAANNSA